MFADISGFSNLSGEHQMNLYNEAILKPIASEVNLVEENISAFNTWGDAFFALFDSAQSACRFSLRMRDLFREDLCSRGLDFQLNIRIALHLGDIYQFSSYISAQEWFPLGEQLTLAARVEPVVRPGEIWVTEPVAYDTAVRNAKDLAFDPLGTIELAKNHGQVKLLGLRRPDDSPSSELAVQPENLKSSSESVESEAIREVVAAKMRAMYTEMVNRTDDPGMETLLAQFYDCAIRLMTGE